MKRTGKINIHNKFEIEVIRDGLLIQKGYAKNIVLDRMYGFLVNFSAPFSTIVFGKGVGTPSPERTTLFNRVGSAPAVYDSHDLTGNVLSVTKFATLLLPEFNGETLTEVGISQEATNINTHAMITDSEGNTISITKTNLDIVKIYATLYVEFEETGDYGFILFPKISPLYDHATNAPLISHFYSMFLVNRSVNLSTSLNSIGFSCEKTRNQKIHSSFGGGQGNYISGPSNKEVIASAVTKKTNLKFRIDPDKANLFNGISHISIPGLIGFSLIDSPYYAGYPYTDRSLGTGDGANTNFAFPNIDPRDLVVKVDGVPTTAFTYEYVSKYFNFQDLFDTDISYRSAVCNGNVESYSCLNTGTTTVNFTHNPFVYDQSIKNLSGLKFKVYVTGSMYSYGSYCNLQGSNDKVSWANIVTARGSFGGGGNVEATIPASVNSYQYLRLQYSLGEGNIGGVSIYDASITEVNRIVFDVAPALGEAITVDYTVPYPIKTPDFVMDFNIEIQWGEGTVV